jgi:hypothetical protein
MGSDREDGPTVDQDGSGARSVHARDDVEKRRLARAVGPDEGHHLARLDAKRDAVEGHHSTEADAELAYFEK